MNILKFHFKVCKPAKFSDSMKDYKGKFYKDFY